MGCFVLDDVILVEVGIVSFIVLLRGNGGN